MNLKKLTYQVIVYSIGLFILAMGVAFAINSDLGISPVNAIPLAAYLASGRTISMGITVIIFFVILILLQIFILRKDFKPINLTQIVFSTMFGYFVNATRAILGDFTLANHIGGIMVGNFDVSAYAGQLIMLAISIVLIAAGLSMYLEAKLISLPSEGILLAIIQKNPNLTFPRLKVIFDCILVVVAIAITLIFLRRVEGVREGTIISAIFIGKVIPLVRRGVGFILGKAGFYKIMCEE